MKSTKRCHKKGLNKAMLRPPPSAFIVEREGIKPKFLLPSFVAAAASIRSDSILCATACAKMAASSLISSSRNSSSLCAAWWVSLCTSIPFFYPQPSAPQRPILCFSVWLSNHYGIRYTDHRVREKYWLKHQVAPVSVFGGGPYVLYSSAERMYANLTII